MKLLILLASLAFLASAEENYGIDLFADYDCQQKITHLNCYDYYMTCVTLGQWWNSYQITSHGDNCDNFAGNQLWNTWSMGFSECGLESGVMLGGGCGENLGCQKTFDFDTRELKPACSIGCFETFSIAKEK